MTDRIYLDSNIIIYRVEGEPALRASVRHLLRTFTREGARFFTSGMAVGECLIGAYKKSPSNEGAFHSAFTNPDFVSVVDVTHPIIERAAVLGAQLNMKLVDSIHVATAEALECSVFLTNDRGIRALAGIELQYLSAKP
jgi:predicted nucleic acid-binding protein